MKFQLLRALPLLAAGLLTTLLLAACQSPEMSGSSTDTRGDDATRAQMRSLAQSAPDWMVGHFVGRNLKSGIGNIEADVGADGHIVGKVADLTAEGQYIGKNRVLWAHGTESTIERTPKGFRAAQARDPSNVTDYQRQ